MAGIGERLKLARKLRRLSQRELAERAGVSAMAISKYENDQMMPGSEVLSRLARALDVRMEFLLRPAPAVKIAPVFRQQSRLGQNAIAAVTAAVQEWMERYLAVESFFPEAERRAFTMPAGFPRPLTTVAEAEEAAAALRRAWRLGEEPIENLTELLEDRGIKVGLVSGDSGFDAVTFFYDGHTGGDRPAIAVRRDLPADRQRFNLALELGHIMLAAAPGVDEEKAAHRFAAAFLAPAPAARMDLGSARHYLEPQELLLLKRKYGLSMAAWLYRAKDLGIVSERQAGRMWREFSGRGWREQEPGEPLPAEEPTRLRRLVLRLVAEDVISRPRAAELLGERLALEAIQEGETVAVPG